MVINILKIDLHYRWNEIDGIYYAAFKCQFKLLISGVRIVKTNLGHLKIEFTIIVSFGRWTGDASKYAIQYSEER